MSRVWHVNILLHTSDRCLFIIVDSRLKINLEKKSRQIQAESSDFILNPGHIRKYLASECTEKLIHAFITSRLDYCNSLLYGVPDHHLQKLQWVMNASARLIFCAPKHCHITPLLQQLYWLPIRLATHRV